MKKKRTTPTKKELVAIDGLVQHYTANKHLVERFQGIVLKGLESFPTLTPFIHSMKSRTKEPEHVKEKLIRKLAKSKESGEVFSITTENLFSEITDLAGVRLLHLHTKQMEKIHPLLKDFFKEMKYPLVEKPSARTWDDEYRTFFKSLGLDTQSNKELYTSVHYVIASGSRTKVTCEIQVRTLMEEVWGEVSHQVNYPTATMSFACKEQIKVLARVTSSATRLVDSIFATRDDFQGGSGKS